ncbi:MAG: hypothetical protein ABI281_02620, partial [Caldimonas sp.]
MKVSMKLGTVAGAALLALGATSAFAQEQCTIKIGRVVPITGPLADVGKDTPWVDQNKVGAINKAGGLVVGNKKCKIDFQIYDSKSTVAGSADA